MDPDEMTAAHLQEGAIGCVKSINAPAPLRRRLFERGLTPGAQLCRRGGTLGGALVFEINGTSLVLRRQVATGITVCEVFHP